MKKETIYIYTYMNCASIFLEGLMEKNLNVQNQMTFWRSLDLRAVQKARGVISKGVAQLICQLKYFPYILTDPFAHLFSVDLLLLYELNRPCTNNCIYGYELMKHIKRLNNLFSK